MRRFRFPVPLSIVLFLALTAAGAYYVRKGMLERAMVSAIENGDAGMIRDLLRCWPCPVHAQTKYRITALHWGAAMGDVEIVELSVAKGARLDDMANVDYGEGKAHCFSATPLWCATEFGHLEAARRLLAAGARTDVGTDLGLAPLRCALENKDPAMIRLLREYGAKE